jgi:hypothetical protein
VLKSIREKTEAAEKPKQAKNNLKQKQTKHPATASQLATGVRMNSTNPVKKE